MIGLVPADEHGLRMVTYHCLYIIVKAQFSFELEENTGEIVTKNPIFTNTDVSDAGRSALLNYVTNWIENNPFS